MAHHEQEASSLRPITNKHLQTESSHKNPGDFDLNLDKYIKIIRRRRRLIASIIAAVVVIGALYTFLQPRIYGSSAMVLVTNSKVNPLAMLGSSVPMLSEFESFGGDKSSETQVALMSDKDALKDVFMTFEKPYRQKHFGSLKKLPKWAVNIAVKRNTDLIEVKTQAYSPEAAAELANRLIAHYIKQDVKVSNRYIKENREYTLKKMNAIKKQMYIADEALTSFKRKNSLIDPETQLQKLAENMALMQMNIDNSKAELLSCKYETASLGEQLTAEEREVVSNIVIKENPRTTALLLSLDELQTDRINALQDFLPDSVEVQSLDNRIKDQEKLLGNLAKTVVDSQMKARNPIRDSMLTNYATSLAKQAATKARIEALSRELDSQKTKAKLLPEVERQLTVLTQKAKLLEKTYEMLSERYYSLTLSEQGNKPSAQQVRAARIDRTKVSPSMTKNLVMLLVLGIALAMLAACIAEQLDTSLHDQENAERTTGFMTLSAVPRMLNSQQKSLLSPSYPPLLLESFRVLRHNVFAALGLQMKIIGVISSEAGEGKSLVSVNLATAMAMDGKRVLLVDCNLHSPTLSTMLDTSCSAGFTNVVTGGCGMEKAIMPTIHENLSLLSTGPLAPNTAELLNSTASHLLFDKLAADYDIVIVDCPSLYFLGDVQAISNLVDSFLLVTSLEQTQKPVLRQAVRAMAYMEAPVLGLVQNRVEMKLRTSGLFVRREHHGRELTSSKK